MLQFASAFRVIRCLYRLELLLGEAWDRRITGTSIVIEEHNNYVEGVFASVLGALRRVFVGDKKDLIYA